MNGMRRRWILGRFREWMVLTFGRAVVALRRFISFVPSGRNAARAPPVSTSSSVGILPTRRVLLLSACDWWMDWVIVCWRMTAFLLVKSLFKFIWSVIDSGIGIASLLLGIGANGIVSPCRPPMLLNCEIHEIGCVEIGRWWWSRGLLSLHRNRFWLAILSPSSPLLLIISFVSIVAKWYVWSWAVFFPSRHICCLSLFIHFAAF